VEREREKEKDHHLCSYFTSDKNVVGGWEERKLVTSLLLMKKKILDNN